MPTTSSPSGRVLLPALLLAIAAAAGAVGAPAPHAASVTDPPAVSLPGAADSTDAALQTPAPFS